MECQCHIFCECGICAEQQWILQAADHTRQEEKRQAEEDSLCSIAHIACLAYSAHTGRNAKCLERTVRICYH